VRIINYGLMLGMLAACSGQARADDNVTAEIEQLNAKLKALQQRVDQEARKTRQVEAQAKSIQLPASYKALAADPCAAGKVCYKGVTLTFGGWVDLTSIYRTRNLASDTGSVYNFIPTSRVATSTFRKRASRHARAGSLCWPKAVPMPTLIWPVTAKSISKARRRRRIRLRPTRSIRACGSSASRSIAAISAFISSLANHGR
jgi:outer membrane murein-binding lipoprotein Lpp